MAEFDSVVQQKQCLLIQVQDRVAQLQSHIHTLQSFLLNGHAHDDVLKAKIDKMIQHGLLSISLSKKKLQIPKKPLPFPLYNLLLFFLLTIPHPPPIFLHF